MGKTKYCYCKNTYLHDCKSNSKTCKAPYYWEFYANLGKKTEEE